MLNKIFIIISLSFLFGCSVGNYEVNGFIKNCEEHGGLVKINSLSDNGLCNDGTWVTWQMSKGK